MSTTALTIAAGEVFADARRHDLPNPITVEASGISETVNIYLSTLADLAQWAQWAEATIEEAEPQRWTPQPARWIVRSHADGSIHELPVHLAAVEFGHMAAAENYECEKCGAAFGVSGGFVADGAPVDDSYEVAVARHQAGECFGAAVTR